MPVSQNAIYALTDFLRSGLQLLFIWKYHIESSKDKYHELPSFPFLPCIFPSFFPSFLPSLKIVFW